MSLVSSRVGLKHLCQIDRNAGTADGWKGTSANWQPHLTNQPCRGWIDTSRERPTEGSDITLSNRTVLLPAGVDVVARTDRVVSVTDQDGNTILDGPMRIHAVINRPGHIELVLEGVR
jgi:hypothetical protein